MYDFLSKSKIIIIDDFAGFRLSLKTMLQRLGARNVDQASNGSEAIKRCTEENYDIIFCDYNLGEGQDGQQILEELHHRSLMRRGTLFLMVTAETTTAQVMGAIEYRPDAYLAKPFSGEQLGQRLKRLIQKNTVLHEIFITINAGDIDKAIRLCDELIRASPKVKFSCLRIKSELLEQQHRYDDALLLYNETIMGQPVLLAMLGLGRLYFLQGDVPGALQHFLSMRDAYPQQVSVLDWVAKCQKKIGEVQEAEETLKQAIGISPKSVTRQATLGEVAASLDHHELAQNAFARTVHEGHYSCMLKPQHFEQYYDNTREVAEKLEGREKSKLLAETEVVHKKMERIYQHEPGALAANLGAAAMLFSSFGQSDKTSRAISKLSKVLENPECKLSDEQLSNIGDQVNILSEAQENKKTFDQIASRLTIFKQQNKSLQEQQEKEIDIVQLAKKTNAEAMRYAKQKQPDQALEKFREAIQLLPENINYRLNASQIILEYKELNTDPERIKEAKHYLLDCIKLDETDIRWNRYQKLITRVSHG